MRHEIFRAGTRTDNNGNTVTITADDVAAIASHYDKTKHEAPIVVGHPTTNAPAFGWVEKLTAENGVLFANFAEVDDDFAELVRKGRYKKVSASFYPPKHTSNPEPSHFYLRHVGFLGAHPPAVKGLAAINFADDEDGIVSFGESEWVLARVLRGLREWIIGKDGIDTADKIIPDWQIDDLKRVAEMPSEPLPQFAEPDLSTPPDKENENMATEQELAAEKAAREKAEKEAATAKAELAKLQAEQAQALRDADHNRNVDFAESLVKAGSLKPADKDLIVQVLDFAEHPEHTTVDFGEGQSLADALKAFLKNGTTILPTGEIATPQRADVSGSLKTNVSADVAEASDPKALSHHERALALQAKENISYHEAARRTAQ